MVCFVKEFPSDRSPFPFIAPYSLGDFAGINSPTLALIFKTSTPLGGRRLRLAHAAKRPPRRADKTACSQP